MKGTLMSTEMLRVLRNLVVGEFVERENTSPNPHASIYREFSSRFPKVPTSVVRAQVNQYKSTLGL